MSISDRFIPRDMPNFGDSPLASESCQACLSQTQSVVNVLFSN